MGTNIKIALGVILFLILAIIGRRLVNYSELKKENKQLKSESKKFDQKIFVLTQNKQNDSIAFANRVSEFQKTIALLSLTKKTAENNLQKCELEKDKILRGELCEETYGFIKKKTRLVPCKE